MNLTRFCLLISAVATVFAADPVPDFRLMDLGASSPRRGSVVSPRDYGMQISAYYFGSAF